MTKPDGRPLRLAGIAEAAVIYEADKSQTRRLLARGGPDWKPTDHAQAVAYQALSKTAQEISEYLRSTPGRLVSCTEIAERFNLNPDGTKNTPKVVAGHISPPLPVPWTFGDQAEERNVTTHPDHGARSDPPARTDP